jgi:phenylalanyl-tRNA synthetase beta chain
LDGEERILKEEDNVLICDKEKPVAIGGIMGGLNSEVTQDTLDVFLEAAMFNPVNIRRTSKSLNLSTDASYRFERGQDVLRCPQAVSRAAALISSLTYGKVAPGILDCYPKPYHHRCISFSPTRCNELLGTNYEASEMRRALFALGFNLSNDENDPDSFQALVPSFRPDVFGEADLFEEVVRTLDFENLPATIPKPPKPANLPPDSYRLRERLRNFMAGQGFLELMSYSFINPQTLDKLGLEETDPLKTLSVKILNPLSEEMGILRTSLIPSLLNSCRLNQYHNQWDLRLFELGAVFLSLGDESSPKEKQSFGALMASGMDSALWCDEKRALDFYDLKGVIEALSETFLETWDFSFQRELIPAFFDTRESAAIFRNNIFIGYMGLLKDSARRNYGLKDNGGPIYLFEIFPEGLPSETVSGFVPYSLYPGITRDLAFLVDSQVSAQELM